MAVLGIPVNLFRACSNGLLTTGRRPRIPLRPEERASSAYDLSQLLHSWLLADLLQLEDPD